MKKQAIIESSRGGTRMLKKRIHVLLVTVLLLSVVAIAACSNVDNQANKKNSDSSTEEQATPAPSESSEASPPEGPFGKYDPPIAITTVRAVTPNVEYLPDQTIDDNVWYREFASELGINLKNEWVVNRQQYPNKITVTMVSGDMPDMFEVNMQQFQTLAQADQLADLTDLYEQYGSDLVKQYYEEADGIKLKAGTVNGKLLGMTFDGGGRDDSHMMYIREDWLTNLGRKAPTTMDELIDLAIAFTKEDPDRNGVHDTYGLALMKDVFGGWAGVDGFINGYGGYAFNPANGSGTNLIILKDASGNPIWGDIQPEVKTALGKLNELFAAGAIHPEFSVMDSAKAGELATSNKVGISFGAFWVPTWPINNMHLENNDVDWGVYEVPTATGSPSVVQSTGIPSRFMVVPKSSKHPEALFKIMNFATEKLDGPDKQVDKYHTIKEGDKNYQIHTLAPIAAPSGNKNQNYHYQVMDAVNKGAPDALNSESKLYYDQIMSFRSGDHTQWVAHTLWDEGGVFATLGKYKQDNRIMMTSYMGAPTSTMVAKGPALRDLQAKVFTQIIMGAQPLEYFDEFAKQWMEQGGNDILSEIKESGQLQ
jgi:putative aldouronate transport system substrate-binding protein